MATKESPTYYDSMAKGLNKVTFGMRWLGKALHEKRTGTRFPEKKEYIHRFGMTHVNELRKREFQYFKTAGWPENFKPIKITGEEIVEQGGAPWTPYPFPLPLDVAMRWIYKVDKVNFAVSHSWNYKGLCGMSSAGSVDIMPKVVAHNGPCTSNHFYGHDPNTFLPIPFEDPVNWGDVTMMHAAPGLGGEIFLSANAFLSGQIDVQDTNCCTCDPNFKCPPPRQIIFGKDGAKGWAGPIQIQHLGLGVEGDAPRCGTYYDPDKKLVWIPIIVAGLASSIGHGPYNAAVNSVFSPKCKIDGMSIPVRLASYWSYQGIGEYPEEQVSEYDCSGNPIIPPKVERAELSGSLNVDITFKYRD